MINGKASSLPFARREAMTIIPVATMLSRSASCLSGVKFAIRRLAAQAAERGDLL